MSAATPPPATSPAAPSAGIITRMRTRKDGAWQRIWLDGERWLDITTDLALTHRLYEGQVLGILEQAALLADAEREQALMWAFNRLAGRAHTEVEIRRGLRRRRHEPEVIDAVIARCGELALLDEADAAHHLVARAVARGWGPSRARELLAEAGAERELAAQALADAYTLERMEPMVRRAAERAPDHQARRRIRRRLLTQGFPMSLVDRYIPEATTRPPQEVLRAQLARKYPDVRDQRAQQRALGWLARRGMSGSDAWVLVRELANEHREALGGEI